MDLTNASRDELLAVIAAQADRIAALLARVKELEDLQAQGASQADRIAALLTRVKELEDIAGSGCLPGGPHGRVAGPRQGTGRPAGAG